MDKVDILLACYNGEQYIANQIFSLQQQTHSNWHLYIRDDGSTDNTIAIIKNLMSIDARITLIEDNKGNLGPALNFKELFKYSTASYAICCDQDDIWFEKKLENLLKTASEKFNMTMPCMIYCDGYGYNSETGLINLQTIASKHVDGLENFLFFNGGRQGCSSLMNKQLVLKFIEYPGDNLYMHDSLVSILAYTFGSVFFLPDKLMLYRQHMQNVTGNMPVGVFAKLKLNLFVCRTGVIGDKIYMERKSFFEFYKADLSKKNSYYFNEYLSFMTAGKIRRLQIIILNKFTLDGSLLKLCIKTLLRK